MSLSVCVQLVRILEGAPQLKYIWLDHWCLPQWSDGNSSSDDRSPAEKEYFARMLRQHLMHLNLRTSFVPLWNCGVPAQSTPFLQRAWCYAEYIWGRDHMVLVDGVNHPGPELQKQLDLEFTGFVARAV